MFPTSALLPQLKANSLSAQSPCLPASPGERQAPGGGEVLSRPPSSTARDQSGTRPLDSGGGRMRFRRGATGQAAGCPHHELQSLHTAKSQKSPKKINGKNMTPEEKVLMHRGYILKIKQLFLLGKTESRCKARAFSFCLGEKLPSSWAVTSALRCHPPLHYSKMACVVSAVQASSNRWATMPADVADDAGRPPLPATQPRLSLSGR